MEKSTRQYERVVREMDEDGDGKVSARELRRLCAVAELSEEEAEAAVEWLDSDGDGLLEAEDLVRLAEGGGEEEKLRSLGEVFGMFAADGSGSGRWITAESLKQMLGRLGEVRNVEECRVMIGRFDLNGDGVICFDEFMAMMIH